jgi:hypothetical protein
LKTAAINSITYGNDNTSSSSSDISRLGYIFIRKLIDSVRFEVFIAVTMKIIVFWDVALCISYVNRRFGENYRLHLQSSSETSVNVRSIQRHIPEDGNLLIIFYLYYTSGIHTAVDNSNIFHRNFAL